MSLPRFLYRAERVEAVMRVGGQHQRLTLILAVTALGAALALILMYISVPVTMKEEVYRYVIERPPLSGFFKYAGAAVVGGALVAAFVSYIATEVAGPEPGPVKLAAIGLLYGAFLPFVTGFMVPVNLFFVRILNLSSVTTDQTLAEELIDLAFGTPRFTFFHGMMGMYQGLAAGAALFVLSWALLFRLRPDLPKTAAFRHIAISFCAAAALASLTLFGPFRFFESLVQWFARV